MRNERWLGVALLVFVILALSSSTFKSTTTDEPNHIAGGYTIVRYGNFSFNREHPPLVNMLSATPLLALPVHMSQETDVYASGDAGALGKQFMFKHNRQHVDTILFWSRLMTVILTVGAACIIFLWSRELFGRGAAYAATLLWLFNPTVIAHGQLTTTDMGATFFMLLALYTYFKVIQKRSSKKVVLAGAALGLALLAKFTLLFIIPMLFLYTKWKHWKVAVKDLAVVGAVALVVLIAGYGFPLSSLFDQEIRQSEHFPAVIKPVLAVTPLPYDYLWGLDYVLANEERHAFLLGQYNRGGWWYFFPVAFLVKEPIPFILVVLVGLGIAFKNLKQRKYMLLVIPIAVYMAFAMTSSINIGIRHILPVYPFLVMLGGSLVVLNKVPWHKYVGMVLATWYVAASVLIFPHYLAYFNEVVGPNDGYKYLIDSNLDWGQDLKGFAKYVQKHDLTGTVDYWGPEPLKLRRINWKEFECDDPRQGWFAVSVNNLVGFHEGDNDCLHWLREYEPVKKIGYTIFVYDIK